MREKSLLPVCCNNSVALQISGLNTEMVVTLEDSFPVSRKRQYICILVNLGCLKVFYTRTPGLCSGTSQIIEQLGKILSFIL